MSDPQRTVPYRTPRRSPAELVARARSFYEQMDRRRSVRAFSATPVPREAVEHAIRAASTAPSGAHQQPWTFVVVDDPQLKRRIRGAAEAQERRFYDERVTPEWREALARLGTDWRKPFLETAPLLVVPFVQTYALQPDGTRGKHYYANESVGLAVGLLIAALHHIGLATVPYTPSPMVFLAQLLGRPANERAFAVLPVGFAAEDATVPDLQRKPLAQVIAYNAEG